MKVLEKKTEALIHYVGRVPFDLYFRYKAKELEYTVPAR